MTTTDALLKDWTRHPSSSPGLVPHLANPPGSAGAGPVGGIGNILAFSLGATEARQKAAYVNGRIGALRGWGLIATSMRFSTGGGNEALRTRFGVLARWSSALLDAADLCYAAELRNEDDGIHCDLRLGPDDSGEVLLSKKLATAYGFAPALWMEVAIATETDTVGNTILRALLRSNGVVSGHPTFNIGSTSWYTIGSIWIDRYHARGRGAVGFQVISRAGEGNVAMGHFRVLTTNSPSYIVLDDDVTA